MQSWANQNHWSSIGYMQDRQEGGFQVDIGAGDNVVNEK